MQHTHTPHYFNYFGTNSSPKDVLHPDSGSSRVLSHTNPWNFTARMMIVRPYQIYKLLTGTPYDVVHVVMPANLSAMWILAAFKILRCIKV